MLMPRETPEPASSKPERELRNSGSLSDIKQQREGALSE